MLKTFRKIIRLSSYANALDLVQEKILDDILEAKMPAAFLQSFEDAFNTTLMFRFNLNQSDFDAWFDALRAFSGRPVNDPELKDLAKNPFKWFCYDLNIFKRNKNYTVPTDHWKGFVYGIRGLYVHLDDKVALLKRISGSITQSAVSKDKLTRLFTHFLDEEWFDQIVGRRAQSFWILFCMALNDGSSAIGGLFHRALIYVDASQD